MSQKTILVVDDERDIVDLIDYNLSKGGYVVLKAYDGEAALSLARKRRPDLIILDLMLPEIDGVDVCKRLRASEETANIPIIMLTARTDEADEVLGLELGAEDYIKKPFSPRVLISRVRAIIRRKADGEDSKTKIIEAGGITIDTERYEAKVKDRAVPLTVTEFRILELLMRARGRVYDRYRIVDSVRGEDVIVLDRTVDVHIAALRKKLGLHGSLIETVRGVGYKFKYPVEQDEASS
ncbi:MAG: response regulator [Candidatus Coatesbacteria bacterium]|nr:response regulator [Candidatus Coatesbacteria bacterium]